MRHLISFIEDLRDRGIGSRSLNEGAINTTSASVELIFSFFSALAMQASIDRYGRPHRIPTGTDAIEWAKKVDGFGVPVILPTSKAGDGAKTGYDLPVIRAMRQATSAQIVASGGAGELGHFYEAVEAGATVLLAASVFHFHMIGIPELKEYLRGRGLEVR